MNLTQQLENLGIDDKQASVYLACLELGASTVQELAKKSGIKRTSIYNFLDEMKQIGLITEVMEDHHILIVPEDPEVLLRRAKSQTKQIEGLMPELKSIFNLPGNKPKVRYYEGEEGLKKAWDDMLASGDKIYGYSDYEKMFDSLPEEILWYVPETRVKNRQLFFCIAKDGERAREVKTKDKEQMRETRLIKNLELDTEINIYGNKVLMLSFRRPYTAVIIEDRAIALSMKSIWELNWNNLKEKT